MIISFFTLIIYFKIFKLANKAIKNFKNKGKIKLKEINENYQIKIIEFIKLEGIVEFPTLEKIYNTRLLKFLNSNVHYKEKENMIYFWIINDFDKTFFNNIKLSRENVAYLWKNIEKFI
ncbi:hypothetical protein [Mycoplasma phocimorsus]|uniref:hypothetical protein n=1 Tax=Mycoplasma phocimorsus TaxID=3045839 RepID=UPI0024C025A5|nr:hypothetical protein [Mycoplasma phocimorsus]MDJ1647258.1 hypothetical protein [Mycoplasma phocimorsus]